MLRGDESGLVCKEKPNTIDRMNPQNTPLPSNHLGGCLGAKMKQMAILPVKRVYEGFTTIEAVVHPAPLSNASHRARAAGRGARDAGESALVMAACRWLVFALCAPLPCWGLLPSITDPSFIEDCVNEHNKYRSQTWDDALAKSARAWGKKCIFKHNPALRKIGQVHPTFFPVGENLFVTTGTFQTKQAIKVWNDEVKDYNFGKNSCKKIALCGHYTQVVWESTYKVGCSVTNCPSGIKHFRPRGPAKIFVCNYGPAGNFHGRRPYTSGSACSACTMCSGKLCTDATHEKLKKYPHWNPNFGSASISLYDQLIFLITIILIYTLQ
ncbi:GLIPR1-like protein 1 isoform X2 [Hypanus sabinus]|uniref:GLIPR1-like protein 1 isoform X2 n=1 Tax=Hypanus sabinus TaxID=79690 RepID=UPI0028C4BBE3|nr:GLIPR1-like protein 1 isoform X2 [Hypanus sabinus]